MSLITATELADLWTTWESALSETCVITPAVAHGQTATPVTVTCAVTQPAGASGPFGGGGNAISRSADVTIWVKRTTAVHSGDTIRWVSGDRSYSVGGITKPSTYDPGTALSCVEIPA